MTVLTHKDPEVDFFENIRHIQLHRRTKALRRLAEVCAESSLTAASIMTFLLPLASQVHTRVTRTPDHGFYQLNPIVNFAIAWFDLICFIPYANRNSFPGLKNRRPGNEANII